MRMYFNIFCEVLQKFEVSNLKVSKLLRYFATQYSHNDVARNKAMTFLIFSKSSYINYHVQPTSSVKSKILLSFPV